MVPRGPVRVWRHRTSPAQRREEADVTAHPERAADVAPPPESRPRWSPLAGAELARDRAREGQARFAFLAAASRWLAKSLDYETTLLTVAGLPACVVREPA
jgi:hypothetical protein